MIDPERTMALRGADQALQQFCQRCMASLAIEVEEAPMGSAETVGGFSCPRCGELNCGDFGGVVVTVRLSDGMAAGLVH